MDYTPSDQPCQPSKNALLVTNSTDLREKLNLCPNAQSLLAYSTALRSTVLVALPCNQWSCRNCADRKIRRLSSLTKDAKPNRLMTLTVDPKKWTSPRDAFDGTRRQIPVLITSLRKRFGDIQYLRCTELTAAGWPHYHFLLRSAYLPQPVVKKQWTELTGATIVDLRQVRQSFRAYTYLVKYLSKLHKIEWTERHLSYSKGFFYEPVKPPTGNLDLLETSVHEIHPCTYLASDFKGETIEQISAAVFVLPRSQPSTDWS